jgi:hypothetical protein
MTNEGKAAAVISLWAIAFNAGLLLAASWSKPIGLMLAISATLIFLVYLAEDARVEAERRRRLRYQQDCERRIQEATRNDKD